MKKSNIIICALGISCGVAFSLTKNHLKEKEEYHMDSLESYVSKLQKSDKFTSDNTDIHMMSSQDSAKAEKIREYFQLDTLFDHDTTTWQKTLAVAKFVARNVSHADKDKKPEKLSAIDLWEYTKSVEPAFNARFHSILLFELLNALNIQARFITCMPQDSTDTDCMVCNHVWLPELNKWAMITSADGGLWASFEDGTPMSLPEIRESYINGTLIHYNPLVSYDKVVNLPWFYTYMAKNSYWYSCWEISQFDQETDPEKTEIRYVHLTPDGFEPFLSFVNDITTHDAEKFWEAPKQ